MSQSIIDRFFTDIAGDKNSIADYTSVIGPPGEFNRIKDLQVILNSWNNILLTPLRTYTWDPEFGSDLYKYVFEPADDHTRDGIKNEIEYRLQRYDDRAQIQDIIIEMFSNGKGFRYSIIVTYNGETGTLNGTIDKKTAMNLS